MQDIVSLLHQSIGSIGPDCDVIRENIEASRTWEADILAAIEKRHDDYIRRCAEFRQFRDEIDVLVEERRREFSCFTPENGRE